jgi:signal peptidase I
MNIRGDFMTDIDAPSAADIADQRLFRRVASGGFLLFLVVWACLPQVGPVFRTFYAASASMEPTLPRNEMFWVNRLAYGLSRDSYDWFSLPISGRWPDLTPKRGDVVTFRAPDDRVLVMRVVGLPGDVLRLDREELWINGARVPRRVLEDDIPDGVEPNRRLVLERLPEGRSFAHFEAIIGEGAPGPSQATTKLFAVPERHLFVMGDNRDNALDSRWQPVNGGVGFLPIERVLGRVEFIYDAEPPRAP